MRTSSASSSTSSVYTSADDARRCTDYERSQFLDLEDIGTAWLLGSHSSHDRSKRVLERFKIDKWVTACIRYRKHGTRSSVTWSFRLSVGGVKILYFNFTWESTSASIRKAKVATIYFPEVLKLAAPVVGTDSYHAICHVITACTQLLYKENFRTSNCRDTKRMKFLFSAVLTLHWWYDRDQLAIKSLSCKKTLLQK